MLITSRSMDVVTRFSVLWLLGSSSTQLDVDAMPCRDTVATTVSTIATLQSIQVKKQLHFCGHQLTIHKNSFREHLKRHKLDASQQPCKLADTKQHYKFQTILLHSNYCSSSSKACRGILKYIDNLRITTVSTKHLVWRFWCDTRTSAVRATNQLG